MTPLPKSGYHGVIHYPHLKAKPWKAYYRHHGMQVSAGYFATAEEAAAAYNAAVSKIKGRTYPLNSVPVSV